MQLVYGHQTLEAYNEGGNNMYKILVFYFFMTWLEDWQLDIKKRFFPGEDNFYDEVKNEIND